jgi:nitroimidazol reductase NimA-like FMN-containing flavoprotein (pyridoxamine 5'-phosphate oxidase superfamily)
MSLKEGSGIPHFAWTGEHLVVSTAPKAAQVRALRQNPKVALTIDTQDQWPPRALLIRGTARVELVTDQRAQADAMRSMTDELASSSERLKEKLSDLVYQRQGAEHESSSDEPRSE